MPYAFILSHPPHAIVRLIVRKLGDIILQSCRSFLALEFSLERVLPRPSLRVPSVSAFSSDVWGGILDPNVSWRSLVNDRVRTPGRNAPLFCVIVHSHISVHSP